MKTETQVERTAILLDNSNIQMVINDDQTFNLTIDLGLGEGIAGAIVNEHEARAIYDYLGQFFD